MELWPAIEDCAEAESEAVIYYQDKVFEDQIPEEEDLASAIQSLFNLADVYHLSPTQLTTPRLTERVVKVAHEGQH